MHLISSPDDVPQLRVRDPAKVAERGFSDVREVRSAHEHRRFALPPELRRTLRPATTT